jgi:hypothetical protein
MVTGTCGVLETALWKKDVGSIRGFPGVLAQGEPNGGSLEKRPRKGPVEGRGGVSVEKSPSPNFPRGGLRLFPQRNYLNFS